MLIWYDLVWNNNLGYVRLNGSYNILKSINFQVAGIPSLCKEKNMNMKSMSYTGKVLWTVWELDVEDYEILFKNYFDWETFQSKCWSIASFNHYSTIIKFGISEINGKSAVLAWNVMRNVRVEEKQRMYTCGHFSVCLASL